MMRWTTLAAAAALFLAFATDALAQQPRPGTAPPRPAPSRDLPIQAFFGTFSGTGLAQTEDSAYFGVTVRDLDMKIGPAGQGGFTATWTTVLRQGGEPGRPRARKRTTIQSFEPAAQPGMFRGTESGDPLDGKQFTWARIQRNTLSVHTLAINEDGSYDLSTYTRTLSGSGMDLLFTVFRDGEKLRTVKGKLIKTAG